MSETTPEDRAEQQATASRDAALPAVPDVDVEADPADVVEQAAPVGEQEHTATRALPLEADAADAAEQAVVVGLDEEQDR